MKTIKEIIQEKLKINSKTFIGKDIEWCICRPYRYLEEEFEEQFNDSKYIIGLKTVIYILPFDKITEYINEVDLEIFKIPERFNDIEDVKTAAENNTLRISELKEWND